MPNRHRNRDANVGTLGAGLQAKLTANFAHTLAHAGQSDARHAAPVSGAFQQFFGHPSAVILHLEDNVFVVIAEKDFGGRAPRMLVDIGEGLLNDPE